MVELPPPKPNTAIVRPHESLNSAVVPPLRSASWPQALTFPVAATLPDPPKNDPIPQRTNRDRAWSMLPGYEEVQVETLEGKLVKAKVEPGYAHEPGQPSYPVKIYYSINDKGEPLIGVRERESTEGVIFYTAAAFKGTAHYTQVRLIKPRVEELIRIQETFLYHGHEQTSDPKTNLPPAKPPAAAPTPNSATPTTDPGPQAPIMLVPTLSGYKQLFAAADPKTFQAGKDGRKIGITIDGVSYTLAGPLGRAKPPQDSYFLIPLTAAQWSAKDGRLSEARLLADDKGKPEHLAHKYSIKPQAALVPNNNAGTTGWRAVKTYPPESKMAELETKFTEAKRRDALKNLIKSVPGKDAYITMAEQKLEAKKFVFQSGNLLEKSEKVEVVFTVGRGGLEVAIWKDGALVGDLQSVHDAIRNPLQLKDPVLDQKVRKCLRDAARKEEQFLGV